MKNGQLSDIDSYIATFPVAIRGKLQKIRETIQKAAPAATEKISYGMPTFFLEGNLVHFAAYKNHIGWYPTPSAITAFQEELSVYQNAKGSVQFPLDQPVPLDLISKMVQFRVRENLEKKAAKKNIRVCPEGHRYTKSSDCPVCPVCEQRKKPTEGWQAPLSAPARRALEQKGIHSLEALSQFREADILALHGIGKTSLPLLRKALAAGDRSFQE
jgi:uncharacterized protein YdhG (YjbR/CyaY superfamily)